MADTVRHHIASRVIAGGAVLAISIGGVSVYAATASASARRSDQKVAIAQLRAALTAQQRDILPAHTVAGIHPSSSDLSATKVSATALLPRLFTGKALVNEERGVNDGLKALQNPDFQVLDGGVGALDVHSVSGSSTELKMSGTYDNWSKFSQRVKGHKTTYTPHNLIDFNATLAKTSGSWKLSEITWKFHPGSEP